MAYWVDDGFDTWPETIRAGSAATGLYLRCGSWIARNLTDGHVPGEVATMYGTTEWTRKLLDVGLWEAEGTGYRDVRYFQMGNPTAETVRARRAAAAERQQRFRNRKSVTRDKIRDSPVNHGVSNDASHSSPALPPPPTGEGRGRTRPRAARAAGAPPSNPDSIARSAAINRCTLCDDRGYLPSGRICQHDPGRLNATRRGAAAARAAITPRPEPRTAGGHQ